MRNFWGAFISGIVVMGIILMGIAMKNTGLSSTQSQPVRLAVQEAVPEEFWEKIKLQLPSYYWQGKGIIFNVWASWEPHALVEMPHLSRAYQKNKDTVVVIGIHRTDTERQERAEAFARMIHAGYPLIFDDNTIVYKMIDDGTAVMPLTVFINKEGIVQEIVRGPLQEEELETMISKMTN